MNTTTSTSTTSTTSTTFRRVLSTPAEGIVFYAAGKSRRISYTLGTPQEIYNRLRGEILRTGGLWGVLEFPDAHLRADHRFWFCLPHRGQGVDEGVHNYSVHQVILVDGGSTPPFRAWFLDGHGRVRGDWSRYCRDHGI